MLLWVLGGLDIASLLIKEVAAHLQDAFPTIKTFSTLSPIPKFMNWLQEKAAVSGNLFLVKLCLSYTNMM